MLADPRYWIPFVDPLAFRAGPARPRRRLILGAVAGLLGAPTVRAQPQRKLVRIGLLAAFGRSEAESLEAMQPFVAAMRERGYLLGENFVLDIRVSGGDARRFPALADELIALKPDVLLGVQTSAVVMAAKTSTIPIVLWASVDPVAAGLVKSLARPGANVTGIAGQGHEMVAKHVELLSDLVPKGAQITMLSDPFWSGRQNSERSAQRAATAKGLSLTIVYVQDAGEVKQAFTEFEKRQPDGLILVGTGLTFALRDTIRVGVLRLRLPAIGNLSGAGESISYAENFFANLPEVADIVDRILKGANPADLPMRQSTRFNLVVNMKNAREIGLKIPQSLLLRADEVIQ